MVDRIPKKQNAIKGRSRCDKCKKELGILDLIPILSFIFLRGKCRYCHTRLPYFYPIIELSTGILFVLTYIFVISNFKFLISNEFLFFNSLIINPLSLITILYYLFIVSSFIVIFFTDLKYGIIPDKIVFPVVLITFLWLIANRQSPIANHLLSGLGAFLFFVIISYLFYLLTKKQSMGGGDIKLSFLLGLFLGFPGILIALYLAFLTGGIIAIILIIWKKKAFLKDTLPFGPFLITGAIISLFFGNYIYFLALNILGI
ncbi:MAG: prepilin peptidase [Actinobacteria bacterium]|nr:prepilin peptidase [Actinomycetota bacterium]